MLLNFAFNKKKKMNLFTAVYRCFVNKNMLKSKLYEPKEVLEINKNV